MDGAPEPFVELAGEEWRAALAAAHGRIVGDAPFMTLRSQRALPGTVRDFVTEDDPAAVQGRTATNPRWIAERHDGWRIVVGHLVKGIDFASYEAADDSGEASVYVYDHSGSGSWALGEYTPDEDTWETKQAGPRDLWAEIGAARHLWENAGRPGRDRFGLTVTRDGDQRT